MEWPFDREGFLYIADAGNQRIVKFWIPAPQDMLKK
jgi:hypothetical protein